MRIPFFQVDAFTLKPFRGNPAAVCLPERELPDELMLHIAAENNLSETAFVIQSGDVFRIRWFTPVTEVPLCGHATLSSAHILWEEEIVPPDEEIRFETRQAGKLRIRREAGWIVMDLPADIPQPVALPEALEDILRAKVTAVFKTRFNGLLTLLESEPAVRQCIPDIAGMRRHGFDEVIVTAESGGEADFVSRFFAPGCGIDEDPVTGSAHCSLGAYWSGRLAKAEVLGHQVSRRGGFVRVRPRGERIDVMGQAVTVIRGHLHHE